MKRAELAAKRGDLRAERSPLLRTRETAPPPGVTDLFGKRLSETARASRAKERDSVPEQGKAHSQERTAADRARCYHVARPKKSNKSLTNRVRSPKVYGFRMNRASNVGGALGAVAAVMLALAGCQGGGGSGDPACHANSWVAGTTELCEGRLIYRDYVYDDYGADTGAPSFPPIQAGNLSPSAGDVRYPEGAENTADLVRLELRLDGDQVRVEFELNTLYKADQTIAALAIDTDGDPTTGGGTWPGLGIRSAGWDEIHEFRQGDPVKNIISGSFPKPPGTTWRLWAVTAQADGTVMNVAFRGPDEGAAAKGVGGAQGDFWEDHQAAALGKGDITEFSTSVDVADLEHGVTRAAEVGPGLHQRVYTSQYTLPPGEGVSLHGIPGRHGDTGYPCEQGFHYLGKYQPYGIYVPTKDGPHGVQLVLHGCSANHASLINQPGMQHRFGEDLNRILLVPLGRGPVGFYSDISERDVLDALGDTLGHYDVDFDEIFSGGYSMGGYGTLRFAALYPQLFAGATNWVGFTGDVFNTPLPNNPIAGQSPDGAVGNVIDFIGNLRNIPIVNLYSGEDELVHLTTALALQSAFLASDVVHDFYLHPIGEHLTYAILDDWQKEAKFNEGLRLKTPSHVTFRTDPSLDYPQYKITHDRAYWVSGIVGRDAGYVDVDVLSRGCGLPDPVFETGNDAGSGPAPLLWLRQFRRVVGETAVSAANRIEAVLGNVASFRIEDEPACLTTAPIAYRVATDGPVRIDFSDGRHLALDSAGTHEGTL
jgi:pimeloyl-ACP methyl ester carboxylesterase